MLTRLYVDNYKAFSNFEYRPAANELLLGRNGTGKSSVFEVLGILRSLIVEGVSAADALDPGTLTRWDTRSEQRFELDVAGEAGRYRYTLSVEYTPDRDKWRIGDEVLSLRSDGDEWRPLFERSRDRAQLYHDDHEPGPPLLLDWSRSGVHVMQPSKNNTRLTWFKERLARAHCIQIDPHRMGAETDAEASTPSGDLANYASWYRHLLQEDPNVSMALRGHLAEVIDGLDSLDLRQSGGKSRTLSAAIRRVDGALLDYSFAELTDGQRALIGLYTVAAVLGRVGEAGRPAMTFCIDEPENYVALAELQPWIHEIEDLADGQNAQVLIASHHPEFINHYAHTNATLFYREGGGPVRTRPFTTQNHDGLLPAELVARGWEDE